MSASAPRAEMSKALLALARTELLLLDLGRVFSSTLAEPAVTNPSLALRFGMNLSAAEYLIVVFPPLDLEATSFLDFSLDGVVVALWPVPVNVQSETPRSRCLGECLPFAMLDFGVCAYANFDTDLDTDRENIVVVSVLYIDRSGRGGVKGDEFVETLVAALAVLVLGEGVNGMRPPAVLDEKMPVWLLRGVDI